MNKAALFGFIIITLIEMDCHCGLFLLGFISIGTTVVVSSPSLDHGAK